MTWSQGGQAFHFHGLLPYTHICIGYHVFYIQELATKFHCFLGARRIYGKQNQSGKYFDIGLLILFTLSEERTTLLSVSMNAQV